MDDTDALAAPATVLSVPSSADTIAPEVDSTTDILLDPSIEEDATIVLPVAPTPLDDVTAAVLAALPKLVIPCLSVNSLDAHAQSDDSAMASALTISATTNGADQPAAQDVLRYVLWNL